MARDGGGGGGGAFAWTLLGFLAGIAATLGLQTLMAGDGPPARAATSAPVVEAAAPVAPVVKPVKKAVVTESAKPAHASSAAQAATEVADDAAAAGMTSRIKPAGEPSADDSPANN